jgi:parallel beta-helix repeat protein
VNEKNNSVEFSPGDALYVSLSGDDTTGVGSFDAPWRTINYGVSQISSDGGEILYIRDGVYYEFVEDFVSGTEGNSNIISSYPGETVVISGGEEIIEWEEIVGSNIYRKYITWSSWPHRPKKLFVNDVTMTWAQYPNDGFLYPNEDVSGPVNNFSSDDLHGPDDYWVGATVIFYGGETWSFRENTIITDYDSDTKTIYFEQVDKDLDTDVPFKIAGKLEELDVPGEWHVEQNDTEGYVYFYPDGSIDDQSVIVAKRDRVIRLNQKNNVEIRDLSVYHQNFAYRSSRGSVSIDRGENIFLDGLDVSLTTWLGIRVNESVNTVINNLISRDIGSSAVVVYYSNDTTLTNSHVSNVGDAYDSSSAVSFLWYNDGITVTNNYIADNYYNYQTGFGIYLGSKNAYVANNEFRNNHGNNVLIEDSRDDSPDSAVKNIVFENNILANARASYTGALWLDNAHNVIVRNNLIYGANGSSANGIKISSSNLKPDPKPGYSKNITVVNNVIFDNTYGMYVYANESINISHNTFVDSRLNGFATLRNAEDIMFKDNLIQSDHTIVKIAEDSIATHNRSDNFDYNHYVVNDDPMIVDQFMIGYNYYNFTEYLDAFPDQELDSVNGEEIVFTNKEGLDFRPILGSNVCGAASDNSDIGALPCYSPSDETPLGDIPGGGDLASISSNGEDESDSSSQDVEGNVETPGNAFHSAWYFIESNTPGVIIILTIVAMIICTVDYVYLRRKKSNNFLK